MKLDGKLLERLDEESVVILLDEFFATIEK